jgi:glutamyl-tRNA(Gln) amidotransferase subunit D
MNEKEEFSGYRGDALTAIKRAEAEIGDIIRITKDKEVYEGILIPRSEYGDEKHVVIKLKSGYNIGIRITTNTRIEKTGKGAKPAFAQSPPPKQSPDLPKVAIISTGGTIASRVDYRTGGVRPALTASDLYSVVPELASIARINAQILFSLFSENITPKHWTEIAKAVAVQVEEGVDGVVVAHGTDTMGYTAAALSFALQNLPVPVILVGSQRSADRPSSDAATKVRKCHTSRRDTFKSVNASPLAKIGNGKTTMLTEQYKKRDRARKLLLKPEFDEKVALVKSYPGINPAVIDWYVEKGCRGIVLEGTGLGHVGRCCFEATRKAVQRGVVVAMASQCIWGRVNMNVYDQGRDLLALGVIPLEDILPETATVKLMWILGQTEDTEEAKRLLMTNIANEFSSRTFMEKIGV